MRAGTPDLITSLAAPPPAYFIFTLWTPGMPSFRHRPCLFLILHLKFLVALAKQALNVIKEKEEEEDERGDGEQGEEEEAGGHFSSPSSVFRFTLVLPL